jgi:putative transcriptional regulator
MPGDSAPINLTNHFLIAMPALEDGLFTKSVVYVCEHSPQGALGLVINKPTDISLGELFEKVELSLGRADLQGAPVFQGGPLQRERGFVLHPSQQASDGDTLEQIYASGMLIPEAGLEMTTSRDVLEALSHGAGPRKLLLTLGYSSWGEGQLESELGANAWLTVAADQAIIFDSPIERRWSDALALLGLQPWMISSQAGHA